MVGRKGSVIRKFKCLFLIRPANPEASYGKCAGFSGHLNPGIPDPLNPGSPTLLEMILKLNPVCACACNGCSVLPDYGVYKQYG